MSLYQEYLTHMKVCEYLGRDPLPCHERISELLSRTWEGLTFVSVGDAITFDNNLWSGERLIGHIAYDLWVSNDLCREVERLTGPENKEQFIIDMFNDYLSENVTALLPEV